MADCNEEIWIPVKGFECLYWISNLGRLRNNRGKIIKGCVNKNNGYHQVMLYKDGKCKLCYTHIIVGETFLEDALNGETCITHLDGNKLNNRADNLGWRFKGVKKNVEFGVRIPTPRPKTRKPIEVSAIIRKYDVEDNCIGTYLNWESVEKNGFKRSSIMLASKGKYCGNKSVYKRYKWQYEEIKKDEEDKS